MKKSVLMFFLWIHMVAGFCQEAPAAYGVLPSKAQLNWHEMQMYCIIHFGVDTYTDKEWGFGDEDPALFNPAHFDASQIVGAAKDGGFKGVVIVAKHHDGLCIWPTKTTTHNISNTGWKGGKGDMVKEYQLACEKLGMQMGLYCSPWDRNSPLYGQPEYVDIYRKQLQELYSNYGKLFISWHDGANGGDGYYGGKNEARKIDRSTYYGWDTTWDMIRKLQPSATIFGDVGPDIRWVGNEEGFAGETCWATYTPQAPDEGKIPSNGYVKYWEGTEGTRGGKYWMPAECDVSLRPGWFYHASQNNQVKSPYTLLNLYYKSVGRGANLDLGLSPNREGRLDDTDVNSLKQFGEILKQTFALNLAKGARLTASNVRGGNKAKFGTQFLLDDDRYSYWSTDDKVTTPSLTVDMGTAKSFNVIRLRENIKLGQRISSFEIEAFTAGKWKKIASATSIGANRLIRLPQTIKADKVRLLITGSPVAIALSDFGLYKEPDHLTAPVISRDREGRVSIQTQSPVSSLHYTLDGSTPTLKSAVYEAPFLLTEGGVIKAIAEINGKSSELGSAELELSKYDWSIMADSTGTKASAAIDEDAGTYWSTLSNDSTVKFQPQSIGIDLKKTIAISSFSYLPRQDKRLDGIVDLYSFELSNDGKEWQEVAAGEFSNIRANPINQVIKLKSPVSARYIRFTGHRSVKGNGITAAEIGISSF
ncbi:discoidin domain-containing protein [Pedobacter sp. AW31-3R]|uniref:discoidin domain-containing protein n=1 Tax=Pedobacter sp. AW31-3R TaxID=3445781 RepID=UPI003FA1619C